MRLLNAELETLAKNSGNELKNLVGKDTASKVDELTAALKKKAEATRESTSATSQAAAAEEKAS
jgi:hypothetical protein